MIFRWQELGTLSYPSLLHKEKQRVTASSPSRNTGGSQNPKVILRIHLCVGTLNSAASVHQGWTCYPACQIPSNPTNYIKRNSRLSNIFVSHFHLPPYQADSYLWH